MQESAGPVNAGPVNAVARPHNLQLWMLLCKRMINPAEAMAAGFFVSEEDKRGGGGARSVMAHPDTLALQPLVQSGGHPMGTSLLRGSRLGKNLENMHRNPYPEACLACFHECSTCRGCKACAQRGQQNIRADPG